MSSNQVFKSKLVGNVVKKGKEIALASATETALWKRTESMAQQHAAEFLAAVKADTKELPAGTTKLIMREGKHASDADPTELFTAIALDENNVQISTLHFPNPKK